VEESRGFGAEVQETEEGKEEEEGCGEEGEDAVWNEGVEKREKEEERRGEVRRERRAARRERRKGVHLFEGEGTISDRKEEEYTELSAGAQGKPLSSCGRRDSQIQPSTITPRSKRPIVLAQLQQPSISCVVPDTQN